MAAMFVVVGGVRWRERRQAVTLRRAGGGPSTAVVGSPQVRRRLGRKFREGVWCFFFFFKQVFGFRTFKHFFLGVLRIFKNFSGLENC